MKEDTTQVKHLQQEKIIEDVKNCQLNKQPVLIGTSSIESSEYLSQALNKDLNQIKKTYADLLPPGELKEAVLGNLKGYLRKSFAIFENPGYEVPITSPLFKKAQQFALNLINGKGGGQFRVEAKKVFGGPGVSEGHFTRTTSQAVF